MIRSIPTHLDSSYSGAAAYLASLDVEGTVTGLARVPEFRLPRPTDRVKGPGMRAANRDAAIAHRAACAAYVQQWSADIRATAETLPNEVFACDGSCHELVDRYSRLSWFAHDALRGTEFWNLWPEFL